MPTSSSGVHDSSAKSGHKATADQGPHNPPTSCYDYQYPGNELNLILYSWILKNWFMTFDCLHQDTMERIVNQMVLLIWHPMGPHTPTMVRFFITCLAITLTLLELTWVPMANNNPTLIHQKACHVTHGIQHMTKIQHLWVRNLVMSQTGWN